MIYLIKIEGHAVCKVGYTVNVEAKKRQMRTYCPFPIEKILTREGSYSDEYNLHYMMRHHHFKDEWFVHSDALEEIFYSQIEHKVYPKKEMKNFLISKNLNVLENQERGA